jgi:hypothetical protein
MKVGFSSLNWNISHYQKKFKEQHKMLPSKAAKNNCVAGILCYASKISFQFQRTSFLGC